MEVIESQQGLFDAQGNAISKAEDVKVSLDGLSPKVSRSCTMLQQTASDDKIEDPVTLKLESALKRSIADRTGNLQLKEEAAREQSRADKLGARTGLSRQQQERAKKEAEQLRADAAAKQSLADRTGDMALKKEAAAQQHLADKLIANANKALLASEKEATTTTVQAPVDATIAQSDTIKSLKVEAAQKQREAARTGDEKLKLEAAKEQSKADKARIARMRLEQAQLATQESAEDSKAAPLARQRSGDDVSLKKETPMSKQKSASNVSLPRLQQKLHQMENVLKQQQLPIPEELKSIEQPKAEEKQQVKSMIRQKSAGNVSFKANKDENSNRFYKLPKAASGNDIQLSQPAKWNNTRQWSPPPQNKEPQQRSYFADKEKQKAQREGSPQKSEQLSWRKPETATLQQSEPKLQQTQEQPQDKQPKQQPKTKNPKQQPAQQFSNKKDAATNTDFDSLLATEAR